MAHSDQEQLATKSGAARQLRVSRRTVQRYCQSNPSIVENGKVHVPLLDHVIKKAKAKERRGFPLKKKRDRKLNLDAEKKQKPIFHRTMVQRLEIIAREVGAMSDPEQAELLALRGIAFLRLIRQSALALIRCGNCGKWNRLPQNRPHGRPICGRCKNVLPDLAAAHP